MPIIRGVDSGDNPFEPVTVPSHEKSLSDRLLNTTLSRRDFRGQCGESVYTVPCSPHHVFGYTQDVAYVSPLYQQCSNVLNLLCKLGVINNLSLHLLTRVNHGCVVSSAKF